MSEKYLLHTQSDLLPVTRFQEKELYDAIAGMQSMQENKVPR